MGKKVIPKSSFVPKKNDTILLDTNILIRLFTAYDQSRGIDYSSMFADIKKAKSRLIITSIQISEFINRCIRIEYGLYKDREGKPDLKYKEDFRSTEEYKNKMNTILSIISEDIKPFFEFVDDKFSQMDESNIFIYSFSYDFNDALLVEIAEKYNAVLITDDSDYANYPNELTIVTSNRILAAMHH